MNKVLKEAGYPGGITIETYVFIVIISSIALLYTLIVMGPAKTLILSIIAFIPIHTYIFISYKERKNKIRIALCDIQDIIYFQSKIGTPIDVILANSAKIAKDPLKIPLEKVSTCFKLTRDLDKALDILKDASSIMEIQAFSYILKQKEQTGFAEQNHKAQAVMMKRNKRLKKRLDRELKRNKLLLAAVLLFACYLFMVAGPIFKEIFIDIRKIMG